MTEEQDTQESQTESGGKNDCNKSKDKKNKLQRPLTKIILRRLPPKMSEETFMEQISPIPEHDYFYFSKPDPSLGNNCFSRAYINFINIEDVYLFRDKFDGYVFLDEKGVEYVGIVEYAQFQRIPKKKKKKDPKCGTIESDPVYQEFIDSFNEQETDTQPKLEFSYPVNDANEKKVVSTPLLDYLVARKMDKRNRDERRRRENDKRKLKILKSKDGSIKEEDYDDDYDIKKGKREWEKDKIINRDDQDYLDDDRRESKFTEKRKPGVHGGLDRKKKYDHKADLGKDDEDKEDKGRESPRETKPKRYSESRKERVKLGDSKKSDKSAFNETSDAKISKSFNDNDIKPFTQLPKLKTDDLVKVIEEMDRKMKLEDQNESDLKSNDTKKPEKRVRRSSYEVEESVCKEFETPELKRQNSLDDSGKSSREDSVEKDEKGGDRRTEKRIRNKDRPSMVIYQPGMGKFSKQRLAKEKETKGVNEAEKQDT